MFRFLFLSLLHFYFWSMIISIDIFKDLWEFWVLVGCSLIGQAAHAHWYCRAFWEVRLSGTMIKFFVGIEISLVSKDIINLHFSYLSSKSNLGLSEQNKRYQKISSPGEIQKLGWAKWHNNENITKASESGKPKNQQIVNISTQHHYMFTYQERKGVFLQRNARKSVFLFWWFLLFDILQDV